MIVKKVLPNGFTVLLEEIPHVRSAAVGVFVQVGSKHEPEGYGGISHFIEHMLFKGTEKRNARQIAESFEELGGQLNAYTSKEHTCFYARVLDENIEEAMDILFDMVFNSTIAPKDVEAERGVILEEINMFEDTPDELVHDIFAQAIFDGHPLGRPILGSQETVSSFSDETIREYYKKHYHPANMVVSVVGNIDGKRLIDRVASYRGYGDNPDIIPVLQEPIKSCRQRLLARDTEQVHICLGVPSISYLDEKRYTQNVMNSILGGGMSSHLFQKIREERGMAYSVYSYPSSYREAGSLAICVGTGPSKVKEFFTILKSEVERFIKEGANETEVVRTQNQIKASLYLGMESVMTRMNRLGKSEIMYGQVLSVEEVMDKVYSVTPKMVQDFASATLGMGGFSAAGIGEADILAEVEAGVASLERLLI